MVHKDDEKTTEREGWRKMKQTESGVQKCCEVVINKDHIGRLLGHVRARLAHRDADVGALESHGIVDPVPYHPHHVPDVLQRLDTETSL